MTDLTGTVLPRYLLKTQVRIHQLEEMTQPFIWWFFSDVTQGFLPKPHFPIENKASWMWTIVLTNDSTASSAIATLETILTLSTILSMLHEQIYLPSTLKPPGPSSYTQPEIQPQKCGATYTCFFGVPYHDTDSNLIHTKQPISSILLHIIHAYHIISPLPTTNLIQSIHIYYLVGKEK